MIDHEVLRATPESGVATVVSRRQIAGKILGVYIKCTDQAGGTLDIDIHTRGDDGIIMPLLVRANDNTDGYYAPKSATHLATDASVIVGGSADFAIIDYVEMDIAGADDIENGIVATIFFEY